MAWLTIDKPLEKCPTVHAETGKRCELFAWHSDYHQYTQSGAGTHAFTFWLSGFEVPRPWAVNIRSSCEITNL